ncbi:mRNA export protein mlo3 [Psilocybe cubensis]|uniref:mRNA export protein mlo3 n=2 Tax=Psilocybe cubensis TaxID=181762 RepID=A0ACB8GRY4_PSICU|nr:mRNA export protein mlo3 [Psilocybe cubensis]KAH9478388.1 mRNA export protein mlo3 [Psilocybe cubensis]
MDKSLDEIIASKPKAGRRGSSRRSSAREQVLGKPVTTPVQRARAAANPAADSKAVVTQASEKIIVSNLPSDVNEAQIKDLFNQTVGALRDITLHYDASGRSKGIATVTFQKKGDGAKAFQQYNNRLIDGKRPMKIELVLDPSRPPPLTSRVAPAPAANGRTAGPRPAATRGRRHVRGRGGARKNDRPPKTAADLDAEMEDYTAANAPAAAAA